MANVLILHATVGTGHKSAAMALEKSLKRAGAERVWVQDTLEYGAEWFRRLYADSWIDLVEKASPIWGMACLAPGVLYEKGVFNCQAGVVKEIPYPKPVGTRTSIFRCR